MLALLSGLRQAHLPSRPQRVHRGPEDQQRQQQQQRRPPEGRARPPPQVPPEEVPGRVRQRGRGGLRAGRLLPHPRLPERVQGREEGGRRQQQQRGEQSAMPRVQEGHLRKVRQGLVIF